MTPQVLSFCTYTALFFDHVATQADREQSKSNTYKKDAIYNGIK